ncbi:MAG: biotin--[acetyl-CoA-carboxylase] ligase [Magnetococcus sp. WYHC-3]
MLEFLRKTDGYVSGQVMSNDLRLSRVAVWKHIKTLQAQGCRIKTCQHRGYRLTSAPDLPTEEAIASMLHTQALGRPLLFFREVDSTNRQLAKFAVEAAEGLTLVADHQTAGRGRMGRAWFSPSGVNVHLSVLLRPSVSLSQVPSLPLVVGCVVARAMEKFVAQAPIKLKWPNDLLINGRKISGILCEMTAETDGVQYVIVGIGLNVNLTSHRMPQDMQQTATSIRIESGRHVSRADVVAEILNQLEPAYRLWCAEGLAPFLPQIAALDLLKGNVTRVEQAGRQAVVEGIADGVGADGTLLLRQPDGSHLSVCSGDAHIVPVIPPAAE